MFFWLRPHRKAQTRASRKSFRCEKAFFKESILLLLTLRLSLPEKMTVASNWLRQYGTKQQYTFSDGVFSYTDYACGQPAS
jgi:hypothetical protein